MDATLKSRFYRSVPAVEAVRVFPDLQPCLPKVGDDWFDDFIVEQIADTNDLDKYVVQVAKISRSKVYRAACVLQQVRVVAKCPDKFSDHIVNHRMDIDRNVSDVPINKSGLPSHNRCFAKPNIVHQLGIDVLCKFKVGFETLGVANGCEYSLHFGKTHGLSHVPYGQQSTENSKYPGYQSLPAVHPAPECCRAVLVGKRASVVAYYRDSANRGECGNCDHEQRDNKCAIGYQVSFLNVHPVVPHANSNLTRFQRTGKGMAA